MKHIILTTDFSENSRAAIDYALDIMKGSQVRFTLFHAYSLSYINADVGLSLSGIEVGMKADLNKLKYELLSGYNTEKYIIETCFEFGAIDHVLSHKIREGNVDMIVVGATGESKISEAIFGSTTSTIARDVECPVLVVPPNLKFDTLKRAVIAVDYEGEDLTRREVDPLLFMVRKFNAEVDLLHVTREYEKVEEVETHLDTLLEKVNYSHYTIYDKEVISGIKTYLEEKENSMLCLVSHQYSFFKEIFHSSLVRKASLELQVPLLVMHNEL